VEIIGRQDIGYLVRYNDSDDLAARIRFVLENGKEAGEKRAKGCKFIQEMLSWRAIGARYEQVYHLYKGNV